MANKTELNSIMDNIMECFREHYSDYTIYDYDDIEADDEISMPALLIQMPSFENVESPINGIFRTKHTFRVYICESYRGDAQKRVRDTALDVAVFIDGNTWGDTNVFDLAKFVYATEDEFNEKITSSEIWYCEWEQEIFTRVG